MSDGPPVVVLAQLEWVVNMSDMCLADADGQYIHEVSDNCRRYFASTKEEATKEAAFQRYLLVEDATIPAIIAALGPKHVSTFSQIKFIAGFDKAGGKCWVPGIHSYFVQTKAKGLWIVDALVSERRRLIANPVRLGSQITSPPVRAGRHIWAPVSPRTVAAPS